MKRSLQILAQLLYTQHVISIKQEESPTHMMKNE